MNYRMGTTKRWLAALQEVMDLQPPESAIAIRHNCISVYIIGKPGQEALHVGGFCLSGLKHIEPKPTAKNLTAHEHLVLYLLGFRAGSGAKAIHEARWAHQQYKDGYEDGMKARSEAYKKAVKRYGAELSILREVEESP